MPTRSATPRVDVVDDDEYLRDILVAALGHHGFAVRTHEDGTSALAAIAADPPDVVVLDVALPDIDGVDVCRRLRAAGVGAPVLFLSARDSSADRVRGLTSGGNDYVTKPFALDEVIARLRIALRRARTAEADHDVLRVHDLEMDDSAHRVRRGEQAVHLSATEYRLLRYLMLNAGRVVSKAQILDHVWQYDFGGDAGVVETYVYYVRRKVEQHPPALIHTVRGVGYCLRPPDR